jgi:hypothetical protein
MEECRVHFLDPIGDHTALRPTASCKDYDNLKDERGDVYAIVSYQNGERNETFVPFVLWEDVRWEGISVARQANHERDAAVADLVGMGNESDEPPVNLTKWIRWRGIIFSYMAVVCAVSAWGLALVIYLLTLYIAYLSGFVYMLLTFVFPVVGQIYWILVLWAATGSFLNTLTIMCLVWVALVLSALMFGALSSQDE